MITSTERKCAWEAFRDPLNSNLSEIEWPGFDDRPGKPEDVEFYDFSESDVTTVEHPDRSFFENLSKKIHAIRPIKVINTKMGLLTITENAVADYHFHFWVLHTNFAITEPIAKIICECPGVDAFIPMTRYRCRLGFPKSGLFNITDVKLEVEKRITKDEKVDINILSGETPLPDETKDKISGKIKELKSHGGYWALYVLPNGNMEVLESESCGDVFNSKLQILEESQKLVGGKVYRV